MVYFLRALRNHAGRIFMEARLTRISREEALRYLGVRGEPDSVLSRDLDRCEAQLRSAARPRAAFLYSSQ